MKILIVNPNTSVDMTKTIDTKAKEYASPGTEIVTLMPKDGPDYIANTDDATTQTPKIIKLIEDNKAKYDYFIIACGFDPGLDSCRSITKNVIGIGQAAILTACAVAKRFSYLNTTPASADAVPDRLRSLGIDPTRCVSARAVGTTDEIVKRRHEMFEVYCQIGQKCIEDGAGALILSCAGMSDIKEKLEKRLKVPVVSGVISAVKMVEQFGNLPS